MEPISIGTIGYIVVGGLSFIVSVFLAGWYLNTKLKDLCKANNVDLENSMEDAIKRITKLETEFVRKQEHDKDMGNIFNLFAEVKADIRNGFTDMTKRIDTLVLSSKSE